MPEKGPKFEIMQPPIGPRHKQQLTKLVTSEIFLGHTSTENIKDQLDKIAADETAELVTAKFVGRVVGMAVFSRLPKPYGDTAEIDYFAVNRNYYHQGVTSSILKPLVAIADAEQRFLIATPMRSRCINDIAFTSFGFVEQDGNYFTRKPRRG